MRILVVDDSAFARGRIVRLVAAAGGEAVQAASGRHALQLAAETRFDAATVDLLMPDMDGLELIQQLHAAYPNLPLIVVSADIQEATQREAIAAGAFTFVSKSRRMTALLDVLAALANADASSFALTLLQQDAFTEMMNLAMGQAAGALALLLEQRVLLMTPKIEIMPVTALEAFLEHRISAVSASICQRFQGQFAGNAALIFPVGHAETLVRSVLGGPKLPGFSEVERAVLAEIGNVVLNATISRLGDQLSTRLSIGLPTVNINLPVSALTEILRATGSIADQAIVLLSRLTVDEVDLMTYLIILASEADLRRLLRSLGL